MKRRILLYLLRVRRRRKREQHISQQETQPLRVLRYQVMINRMPLWVRLLRETLVKEKTMLTGSFDFFDFSPNGFDNLERDTDELKKVQGGVQIIPLHLQNSPYQKMIDNIPEWVKELRKSLV